MCSICRSVPCHPRCPNALGTKAAHTCEECGEGIFPGDQFLATRTGYICRECLEDMDIAKLLGMFGEMMETAQEDHEQ